MRHLGRRKETGGRRITVGIAAAAFVLALFLYRPFDARPFEFLDFPEFLGILENGPTLADRTRGLVAYYEGHGRANVLAYALVAVRWTLYGRATAAWQVTRFLVMCAVVVAVYLLVRRLGGSRVGSAAGASLFVTTDAAAQGWLRLSMMEPLATLFLLCAALLAARFQRAEHWEKRLGGIAMLVMAAILSKEVIVAAIPLVAMVGLSIASDGVPSMPEKSRRNVALIAAIVGASALALVPTIAAVLGTQSTAYAARYGAGPLEPSRIASFLLATLVPFDMFASNIGAVVATISYVLLGAGGFAAATRGVKDRRRIWIPLGMSVVVVLGGAVVYLPWPSFELFYTIPYLIAPGLLVALAITAIERHSPRTSWVAYAAVSCVSLYALSHSHALARRTAAAQRLVDRTADAVADLPGVDTAVFAVRVLHPQSWQGTGPTVARYARAVRHLRFPPVVDAECDRAYQQIKAAGRQLLLVVLSSQCTSGPAAEAAVQERFRRWDWNALNLVDDSLRVGLVRGKIDNNPATRAP